jgi:hypothetical protein
MGTYTYVFMRIDVIARRGMVMRLVSGSQDEYSFAGNIRNRWEQNKWFQEPQAATSAWVRYDWPSIVFPPHTCCTSWQARAGPRTSLVDMTSRIVVDYLTRRLPSGNLPEYQGDENCHVQTATSNLMEDTRLEELDCSEHSPFSSEHVKRRAGQQTLNMPCEPLFWQGLRPPHRRQGSCGFWPSIADPWVRRTKDMHERGDLVATIHTFPNGFRGGRASHPSTRWPLECRFYLSWIFSAWVVVQNDLPRSHAFHSFPSGLPSERASLLDGAE